MRIDHVALFCKDLEQMRQFFINYFEATSNELYHNPRTGLRTYILTFPNGGELRDAGYQVTSGAARVPQAMATMRVGSSAQREYKLK